MRHAHLRYNGFAEVLKKKFGTRVFRVTLNAGFTCPNRDGKRSLDGCVFCNDDDLLGKSWHKQLSLSEQLEFGVKYLRERHNAQKILAYFQNGTNTHAAVDVLERCFHEVLLHPDVVGLIIATRPDCLGEPVIDLLSQLNQKTYLWVDVGLQSTQNRILEQCNRGHTVEEFQEAVTCLARHNINTCAHVIFGLPGETQKEMVEGASFINSLPVTGIKLHNLLVTKGTRLAAMHETGVYTPLTREAYVRLCVDYLERLRPDIVIHRLNAHAPDRLTVAPKWSVNKLATLNAIHEELVRRDVVQGGISTAAIGTGE